MMAALLPAVNRHGHCMFLPGRSTAPQPTALPPVWQVQKGPLREPSGMLACSSWLQALVHYLASSAAEA